jgi:bone morphogenetic protein 2/4
MAGFLMTASLASGQSVNDTVVRFAQRGQHHDSKQPVLVTFTDRAPVNIYAEDSGRHQ